MEYLITVLSKLASLFQRRIVCYCRQMKAIVSRSIGIRQKDIWEQGIEEVLRNLGGWNLLEYSTWGFRQINRGHMYRFDSDSINIRSSLTFGWIYIEYSANEPLLSKGSRIEAEYHWIWIFFKKINRKIVWNVHIAYLNFLYSFNIGNFVLRLFEEN